MSRGRCGDPSRNGGMIAKLLLNHLIILDPSMYPCRGMNPSIYRLRIPCRERERERARECDRDRQKRKKATMWEHSLDSPNTSNKLPYYPGLVPGSVMIFFPPFTRSNLFVTSHSTYQSPRHSHSQPTKHPHITYICLSGTSVHIKKTMYEHPMLWDARQGKKSFSSIPLLLDL